MHDGDNKENEDERKKMWYDTYPNGLEYSAGFFSMGANPRKLPPPLFFPQTPVAASETWQDKQISEW